MVKVVLFNGPPSAGKNTGCLIARNFFGCEEYALATRVKVLTHKFFGIDAPPDFYEKKKGVELKEFNGWTPRQAYIYVSEKLVKPFFGQTVWAERLVKDINDDIAAFQDDKDPKLDLGMPPIQSCVVSDLGFEYEIPPFVTEFGNKNIMIIRVHREGCDFKGDSRGYVMGANNILIRDIHNDTTIEDYAAKLRGILGSFLGTARKM